MKVREAVIVDTGRTAIGKRKGALANWHPTDLLGYALRSVIERDDLDPSIIDDVAGGCVTQSGEQGTT
jgi:acetyl-CoA acyltransferase